MIKYQGIEFDTVKELVEYKKAVEGTDTQEEETAPEAAQYTPSRDKVKVYVPVNKPDPMIKKIKEAFRNKKHYPLLLRMYELRKDNKVLPNPKLFVNEFKDVSYSNYYYYVSVLNKLLSGKLKEYRAYHCKVTRELQKRKNQEKNAPVEQKDTQKDFRKHYIDNTVNNLMKQDHKLSIEGARAKAQMSYEGITKKAEEHKKEICFIGTYFNSSEYNSFLMGLRNLIEKGIKKIDREYLEILTSRKWPESLTEKFWSDMVISFPTFAKVLGVQDKFKFNSLLREIT